MLKIKSLKFILLEIAIIIILMSVGYAEHENINVLENTSNAREKFSIQFQNAKVFDIKGANKDKISISISKNGDALNFNVFDLEYPGAYVEFSVDIVNRGSIPAKLESIKVNGIKDNSAIKIKGLDKIDNQIINVNEESNLKFIVEWDEECNIVDEEITNFSLNLNYIQVI